MSKSRIAVVIAALTTVLVVAFFAGRSTGSSPTAHPNSVSSPTANSAPTPAATPITPLASAPTTHPQPVHTVQASEIHWRTPHGEYLCSSDQYSLAINATMPIINSLSGLGYGVVTGGQLYPEIAWFANGHQCDTNLTMTNGRLVVILDGGSIMSVETSTAPQTPYCSLAPKLQLAKALAVTQKALTATGTWTNWTPIYYGDVSAGYSEAAIPVQTGARTSEVQCTLPQPQTG